MFALFSNVMVREGGPSTPFFHAAGNRRGLHDGRAHRVRVGTPVGHPRRGSVLRPWTISEPTGVAVAHAYGSWGFRPHAIQRADQNPIVLELHMQSKCFIGADVAQDWIDIAVAGQPSMARRIANTPEAIADWVASLDAAEIGLVAFEPTGGLER